MEQKIAKILADLIWRYPILKSQQEQIWKVYKIMEESFSSGGKLLVAGNGGSASDAGHIVGELMKGFVKTRKMDEAMRKKLIETDPVEGPLIAEHLQGALPAISVVDHIALSSANLNDMDPMIGFAQQVFGYGRKQDVFLGISTSGNSQNILLACTVAHAMGIKVIGLTGGDGGRLKERADVAIVVGEKETFKIQELHLPVYHALCLMLEERFF